ncbi:hypothetical protein HHI36_008862, partial [Cryptolaemus montrouzieri]
MLDKVEDSKNRIHLCQRILLSRPHEDPRVRGTGYKIFVANDTGEGEFRAPQNSNIAARGRWSSFSAVVRAIHLE